MGHEFVVHHDLHLLDLLFLIDTPLLELVREVDKVFYGLVLVAFLFLVSAVELALFGRTLIIINWEILLELSHH